MRRTFTAVAVWVAATVAAVALASAAIGTVVERGEPGPLVAVPAPAPAPTPAAAPTPRAGQTAPPGTPVAEPDAGPAAETRTYDAVGGSAAVRASPDAVEVLWATPATGFRVDVDDTTTEARVEFRSGDHRSRIRVWAEDGRVRERVEEDPR